MSTPIQYPHCDPRVLHAPNQCDYCDKHPLWQSQRILDKVNFTGQAFEGKSPCPADAARGIGTAHQWPGNRPRLESGYEEVKLKLSLADYERALGVAEKYAKGGYTFPSGFTPRPAPSLWHRFVCWLKGF